MKNTKALFICLLLSAGETFHLAGEPVRTDINPALRYYQAFLVAPDLNETDFDYLATNNLWSTTLPPHFGELVSRYDTEFKILRQAALSTVPCDWGLDLSQGPATVMPHLARVKAAMIGARYRVAWELQCQLQTAARDDFLAAFTLARNVSRDGTLISALVQFAAEAIGCDIIAENFGKFSPETLQQIVQGIDAAPAPGTTASSIAFEKTTFHDWLVRKIQDLQKDNPGDESKVMAGIRDLLGVVDPSNPDAPNAAQNSLWGQLINSTGNTSDGILKLLDQEGQAYDRLAEIMALPYGEFDLQAKQFTTEIQQSKNPFLSHTLPACLKARQREFKLQVWRAMLHAALEYRLHGDPGLLNVNDPCGQGPFAFQRFTFDGVDRGFQLKSVFEGSGFPEIMIFVEKPGPPFLLDGPHVGQARALPTTQK